MKPNLARFAQLRQIFLAGSMVLATLATAQAEEMVVPNEHLTVQGIPAIPKSMAEQMARYNDFRPRKMLDWHPQQRALLISTRTRGNTVQLHLLKQPMGEMQALTDFPDPVRQAWFQPTHGKYLIFEKDEGGNEAAQLYRLDLASRKITLLTNQDEKNNFGAWDQKGRQIAYLSTQLDKTGKRTQVNTDIWLQNPLQAASKRKLISLPGGGWGDLQFSPDGKQLLAMEYKSANQSLLWLINIKTAQARQVLPAADGPQTVAHGNAYFSRDGKHLVISSDAQGEFRQLYQYHLATGKMQALSAHIAWDLNEIALSHKHDLAGAVINRDGLAELRLFDLAKGRELPQPRLPLGAVENVDWHKGHELAFTLDSAQSPGEVWSLNVKTGKAEQWTRPDAGGIDTSQYRDPEIVRWKSFDGLSISGLMHKPPAKFTGPRPVLISIHGGPEAQAQLGFLGRNNYLVNELGITLIQPNVRGSSGYGKTFLKLDNGMLREDSVKDIGALLDWIATQPDLDPKRVVVMGGSYGGYMSLAVSTHYAERIVGAIDVVGISHFVTFLERTETYRRDLRRVEYGDERVPEMRAFLDKIAPLNNAHKISKPLFVIQGKNDPRVPLNEAEQIVARVRQNNVPVWYLMADNEGHGFARKPNQDFYLFSVARFLQEYLLK